MNQSNKALREQLADIIYTGWELDLEDEKIAAQAIALVTNHIKGKMPEKISYIPDKSAWSHGNKMYNQALDEVSQILKEMGE